MNDPVEIGKAGRKFNRILQDAIDRDERCECGNGIVFTIDEHKYCAELKGRKCSCIIEGGGE